MTDTEAEDPISSGRPTEGLELIRSPSFQPEAITTSEAAENAFDAIRAETNGLALTEGSGKNLAEAMGRESMMLLRREQLRAYADGGDEVARYQHFAQGELIDAGKLLDYAEGRT